MKTFLTVTLCVLALSSGSTLYSQTSFSECGTIVDHFGLCQLFETSNGDRFFLDNYGTYAIGDQAFVEGDLDPGCFNTCTAVPCVFNNTIADCPTGPNFSECGVIVDQFGLCMLFEIPNGDRFFLDNYGTYGIGDEVLVEGDMDPGCFNTCSAVPCVFNNTIVDCPSGPNFSECGVIVDQFGLCMLFEIPNGDRFFLDNYGTYAIGDQAFVEGDLDPGCFNTCTAVPCVFNNTIADCPTGPNFSECGVIVDQFGLCMLFEIPNGDRFFLDNYGTYGIGDEVLVEGDMDPGCFNTCSAVPCVFNNTIVDCPSGPNFSECGVIVDQFGLCMLFEIPNGDRFFLDNYGTYGIGDEVLVEGDMDPGCFNTCSAVPCVFNNTIVDCPSGPNFSECGVIVDQFGLCMLFEIPNGDRFFLDNYGTYGIGDEVLVEGDMDPGCFNTCSAVPCVFNNTIVDCPVTAPEFSRGDCNDDGMTDIGDAIFSLDNLFGTATPVACQDACDANDDGMIDIADPISILNALFQNQPLPAPWMTCGTDSTPSVLTCETTNGCP